MNEAFRRAISEFGYEGSYQGVYPVKTNQTKEVVEEILRAGNRYHYGLEAGSKPELMIALNMELHPEALVLCNGYKDEAFIRMALLARKAGRNVVITVEKMTELPLILKVAKELKVEPLIGLRAKLNAQGSGKWETSAGDHAKFGLTTREILDAIEVLEKRDLLESVIELHFHIGSQITDIRKIKSAMKEATRMNGTPRLRASSAATRSPNSAWVLSPVPTAVPPTASSDSVDKLATNIVLARSSWAT